MAGRMEEVSIALLGRLQRAGPAGYAGIVAAFLVWVLFSLPTTPLEIGISYVYGLPLGLLASVFGKTAGSALAFLGCKAVGKRRGWRVPARLTQQLSKLDEGGHPLMSLILIRLAPIPLGMKNYGLALVPSCGFGYFTLASLIVNVPFSVLWCLLGSQAQNLRDALGAAKRAGGRASMALTGGAAGVLLLAWAVSRLLRRQPKRE